MQYRISDVVDKIRARPPMYLGNHSVVRLRAFLHGYLLAMDEAGHEVPDAYLLMELQELVEERFRIHSSHGWDSILTFMAASEAKGLDYFWECWDQVLEADKKKPG